MAEGFKTKTTYSEQDLYTQDGIYPAHSRDVATLLGIKSARYSEADRAKIKQFVETAKSQQLTVPQAIAEYKQKIQEQGTAEPSEQSSPSFETLEFHFSAVDEDSLALLGTGFEELQQSNLAQSTVVGMLGRLQELAAQAHGRNRVDMLGLGLVQPQNEAEAKIAALAKKLMGVEKSLPPFAQRLSTNGVAVDLLEGLRQPVNYQKALSHAQQ